MIDFCILGSGLSGSTIANLLHKKHLVEIIDKAKGVGGRSSNKKINKSISFDHGLQYYSPKGKRFKKFLNILLKNNVLKIWDGPHLDLTFKKRSNCTKIIGVKGNNDLNKHLLHKIKKNLGCEILNIKFKKTHWEIFGKNKKFEAKNIIITFPFEQAKKLAKKYLDHNFLNLKIKMTPNITLMLKQKTKSKIPIASLRLNNQKIAWIANENSKKRFNSNDYYWTIQTSARYSNKIINSYKNKKKIYSKQIAKEFSKIIGVRNKNLKLFKIHGWKYSYNEYRTKQKCYWSKKFKLGICGDWFIGPNAESSWESAHALFNKIKKPV